MSDINTLCASDQDPLRPAPTAGKSAPANKFSVYRRERWLGDVRKSEDHFVATLADGSKIGEFDTCGEAFFTLASITRATRRAAEA